MKASILINKIKEKIEEVGDIDVCVVTDNGVFTQLDILTYKDYYDDGIGLLGGENALNKIAIDSCND